MEMTKGQRRVYALCCVWALTLCAVMAAKSVIAANRGGLLNVAYWDALICSIYRPKLQTFGLIYAVLHVFMLGCSVVMLFKHKNCAAFLAVALGFSAAPLVISSLVDIHTAESFVLCAVPPVARIATLPGCLVSAGLIIAKLVTELRARACVACSVNGDTERGQRDEIAAAGLRACRFKAKRGIAPLLG